jgi:hypothetical protein
MHRADFVAVEECAYSCSSQCARNRKGNFSPTSTPLPYGPGYGVPPTSTPAPPPVAASPKQVPTMPPAVQSPSTPPTGAPQEPPTPVAFTPVPPPPPSYVPCIHRCILDLKSGHTGKSLQQFIEEKGPPVHCALQNPHHASNFHSLLTWFRLLTVQVFLRRQNKILRSALLGIHAMVATLDVLLQTLGEGLLGPYRCDRLRALREALLPPRAAAPAARAFLPAAAAGNLHVPVDPGVAAASYIIAISVTFAAANPLH